MARILIVEDELSIAELEKDYLENEGFETVIETDGMRGLIRAKEEDYDLFLLDLMLPGTDGFEILSRLRETKNTPVLLVSAKKDDMDKIRGLGLGADDYITKPFSPSELVARVKAHLARYEALTTGRTQGDVLSVRGLKIDRTARRVTVNGEDKTLTQKEYEILLFLAEHPNRVYTKKELFQEIWGEEGIGENATVTVHIQKLRDKIEVDKSNPQYIETSWGVGYRFRM